jgi:hypothetical protein
MAPRAKFTNGSTMKRRDFLFAALAAPLATSLAIADEYRSNFVEVSGVSNRAEIERECDAIIFRLADRYGAPKSWMKFPVVFTGGGRGYAGCTYYQKPRVVRVEICQPFASARGGTLDHELTHAFFFYLLNNSFSLFFNEGVAQNSEYAQRERLRSTVYRRAANGEFVPLESLVNRNSYDGSLLIYHQGFSVVDFLIARGGSAWLYAFLDDLTNGEQDLNDCLKRFYGYKTFADFESDWWRYVDGGQNRSDVKPLI